MDTPWSGVEKPKEKKGRRRLVTPNPQTQSMIEPMLMEKELTIEKKDQTVVVSDSLPFGPWKGKRKFLRKERNRARDERRW